MPLKFEETMIRPTLKNDSLDHEEYSHFRPTMYLELEIYIQVDREISLISIDRSFKGTRNGGKSSVSI